jgi:hypothetical protein
MVRAPVTIRLAYSIRGWILQDPETRWAKQVGQSGQPSPEPVRRTAAPVRTIKIIEMKEARANQRNTAGVTRP